VLSAHDQIIAVFIVAYPSIDSGVDALIHKRDANIVRDSEVRLYSGIKQFGVHRPSYGDTNMRTFVERVPQRQYSDSVE
jgi:hypothetical protein